jgi:outer membrane receptor protein involved in Fe transport
LLDGTGCTYRMIDPRAVEVVAVVAATSPPILPRAQPRPAPNPALDEVLVVATRRPARAENLAYAVSLLDQRTLIQTDVQDVSALAGAAPSMTVTNLGPGRDKILIRGLSDGPLTGRTQATVGVYLDDVRLTYNAPDPDLRLTDMGQIEVLRGPQGALYGAGSLGGVVQLVTVQPMSGQFGGWVSASGGWTRNGDPSNALDGMVNLPLLGGRGALRLVGYREVEGGYIDDAALGLSNVNGMVRAGGRAAASLEIDDHWTIAAGLVGQGINSDDTQYAVAGQPPYTRRNQLREPHDNDFAEANLGLRGDFDSFDARWTTAFVRHRLYSRYDASAAPPVQSPPGPTAFDDEDAIQSVVSEATLSPRPSAPIQWLAGAFYSYTRQDIGLTLTSLAGAPLQLFGEERHDRLDEYALFGEAVLPLTHRVSFTVGGRAFLSDTEVRSGPGLAPAGPDPFFGHFSHEGFAPKMMLSYQHSPGLLVYAQAAEGYRAGGINTTGVPGQVFSNDGGSEPNRFYQGDELWTLEAGVRASTEDGRIVVRSAIFRSAWSNIQSDQLLPSGLPFTANIGDGRNIGLEFEGRYAAGEFWLRGSFLIDSPELDRANPAFPARPDLGLAGVPGVQANASAHYAWPLAQGRRLELDGRYAYVGASHLTFDAVTSPRMGGYSTSRLATTLTDERWRLTLAAENLADTYANTFAYGNPFTLRTERQITPLRPTTVSLALSVAY